jgi:hypothetical protein
MQIGRFLRKGAERFVTNPVRGVGRIARGNVRQGLRDIAPAAQVGAMFVPGGQAASAGLGALAGALGQERGASVGDFARGAVGGAGTAMAGRFAQQNFRAGMADGGGIGGGIKGIFTGAGRTPGTPPAPGEEPRSLLSRAGNFLTGGKSGEEMGGPLGFVQRNQPLVAGVAKGVFEEREGRADRALRERELGILQSREDRAMREEQEERERRQRVAQMLAPLFQQMQQRQYFS